MVNRQITSAGKPGDQGDVLSNAARLFREKGFERTSLKEIAEACNQELSDPFVMFCEERILGGYRWAYYQDQLMFDDLGWLYLTLLGETNGQNFVK